MIHTTMHRRPYNTLYFSFNSSPFSYIFFFFFFNDPATTEIYTLSLHDALPICPTTSSPKDPMTAAWIPRCWGSSQDRKSTRLNSSHITISYAVFCLKKKKKKIHSHHKSKNHISSALTSLCKHHITGILRFVASW